MEPSSSHRRRPAAASDADGVCATVFVDEQRVAEAQAAMPPRAAIESATDLFSALADPTRFRLLFALGERELCVCDLSKLAGRSMPAISHQLQLLRRAGLVTFRMEGKLAYYRVADAWVNEALRDVLARIERGPAG